ncbi:two-component system response regulator PilR (NtrC family) [Paucimonas lemoignei]|uniref:Two-component system response regulator PilR (NtrC family) n=1 Tax=Paucimonas lemoignei TaxID=29443 RepID=A0A4R3HX94_PAULE|nr:sigma-54 dependent transcriptional regulator [Paucimonas lemoignei]TCS36891.1 two-component system response regulator PilR (NtrC family) [Paucimonas lemoignei]
MTVPRILVVDDEADLRELVEITLLKMGLDVDSADRLSTARAFLQQHDYALVLTDMRLPDGLGIELVREVTGGAKNIPIAVITAFGSAENAVTALKAGAFDYLSKPVGLDQLRLLVQSALRISTAAPAPGKVAATASNGTALRLMGESALMRDLRTQIVRLARSMAPIAITGESGTGKELAARDIHAQSARADKPFIAVNCGAIPEALMEAEFFGYRKGAFTGAAEDRDGFFQAANGGTLLLDEVADLPLAMQVKLLRAIQERRVRKVGATIEEPVDVRLISATHQNLAECVEKGKFRQDLYYRLNVIELRLPPLRERLEDIGLLADAILAKLAGPEGKKAHLTPEALAALRSYAFPGNVRELENILERALAFANEDVIEVADLALKPSATVNHDAEPPAAVVSAPQPAVAPPVTEQPVLPDIISEAETITVDSQSGKPSLPDLPIMLPDYLDQIEREMICQALGKTRFNRTQAAELLGISFRQLRYRMQRLNIHEPD